MSKLNQRSGANKEINYNEVPAAIRRRPYYVVLPA